MFSDKIWSTRQWSDAARYVAAIATLLISTACNFCDSAVLTSMSAPTTANRVYVFETNCGATVDFSRQVTLARGPAVPRPRITESVINEGTVFRASGRPEIQVRWDSDMVLTITYRLARPSDH